LNDTSIQKAYEAAKERYAELGVDADKAMQTLAGISISMHCWQGDDVGGFENAGSLDGGLVATGNYIGKARTPDELRADADKAYSLIPGKHRFNLHAMYAETDGTVDRNELDASHFAGWTDWAKASGIGLDFNPTYFAHPKASSGFTLSNRDEGIRKFWVDHGIACRKIGAEFGKKLGTPSVVNVWIPDGMKDIPVDRKTPRQLLEKSLDAIFAESLDAAHMRDAVESKLFGIGSESYVVGSHEFYMGYAVKNKKVLCLDVGHFHPTEQLTDKLSSIFNFVDEVLLHISRGVRWDSDHVCLLTDDVKSIAEELVRGEFLDRTYIALDFFDASINRVAAWTIGMRCAMKALLIALLEPIAELRGYEEKGDFTSRLAMLEELKTLPFGAVWDQFCLTQNVPVSTDWLAEVQKYEKDVLSKR
jgi:L-rhamnose isomerase